MQMNRHNGKLLIYKQLKYQLLLSSITFCKHRKCFTASGRGGGGGLQFSEEVIL